MEGKCYRVRETTSLSREYEKYRGQIGTCVYVITKQVLRLKFHDEQSIVFALEELKEVKTDETTTA